MYERTDFDDFWEQIDQYNAAELAELFPEITPRLFQALTQHFMQQEEISIGNGFHGPISWAIVTYDWYDSNKTLAFRMNNNSRFSLYFQYWDDDGLLKELDCFLDDEQLKAAPEGLILLMKEAIRTGKGIVANRRQLQKQE